MTTLRKGKKSQVNNLKNFPPQSTGKKKAIKPKSRKTKIINIGVEINEIGNRKTTKNNQ